MTKIIDQEDGVGIARAIAAGEVSASEVLEEAIERIEELNPHFNALVYKAYDDARKLAREVTPESSALAGVPFVAKDLALDWAGMPTTNSCAFFAGHVASSDSEIARRVKAAGIIPVGKSNVPENGWCYSVESRFHGRTLNPWDESLVPGGSSGGSAVAVATHMVPIGDASDLGGSIRVPAAINGLVGLKISRGRTTMGPGVVDLWSGSAVFNCVTRTVRDTAAYLDVIGGALPGEPYALAMPDVSFLESSAVPRDRLRIGVMSTRPDGNAVDPEVRAAVEAAAKLCETLGHEVADFDLRYDWGNIREFFVRITATTATMMFEAAGHAMGRQVTSADVEPVTWEMIELGRQFSAVSHAVDTERLRQVGRQLTVDQLPFDVVITPVMPVTSRPLGWYDMSSSIDSYHDRLLEDMQFMVPFNMAGQPALSLPLGSTSSGLPLGVQFVGGIGDEAVLLSLATQLEEAAPWKDRMVPPAVRGAGTNAR
ncbi:amidase [Micromonospora inyonensis]|uniref:Amidase n=1 Tax=Micromonospora inyonensis TaxID=47866 RepID=A0A1C6SAP9_9ACTN|nr:amidase family protein [Micromonospora inyonensis]SCL26550.1 amidase [Micromonospora inyonensis]